MAFAKGIRVQHNNLIPFRSHVCRLHTAWNARVFCGRFCAKSVPFKVANSTANTPMAIRECSTMRRGCRCTAELLSKSRPVEMLVSIAFPVQTRTHGGWEMNYCHPECLWVGETCNGRRLDEPRRYSGATSGDQSAKLPSARAKSRSFQDLPKRAKTTRGSSCVARRVKFVFWSLVRSSSRYGQGAIEEFSYPMRRAR